MKTCGKAMPAILMAALLASAVSDSWTDESIYRSRPNPEMSRSIALMGYLMTVVDAAYQWDLKAPDTLAELCKSPVMKMLPCEGLKNPYTGEALKEGTGVGEVLWKDSGGNLVVGVVQPGLSQAPPSNWELKFGQIRRNLETDRRPIGYSPALWATGATAVPDEQKALWALGYFLRQQLFFTFRGSCDLPKDMPDFARMRAELGARKPGPGQNPAAPGVLGYLRPLTELKNPLTGRPAVETAPGEPGYVEIVWVRSRPSLRVTGTGHEVVFEDHIPARPCVSPVAQTVMP